MNLIIRCLSIINGKNVTTTVIITRSRFAPRCFCHIAESQVCTGQKESTLDRLPVHRRAQTPFTLTSRDNVKSPVGFKSWRFCRLLLQGLGVCVFSLWLCCFSQ